MRGSKRRARWIASAAEPSPDRSPSYAKTGFVHSARKLLRSGAWGALCGSRSRGRAFLRYSSRLPSRGLTTLTRRASSVRRMIGLRVLSRHRHDATAIFRYDRGGGDGLACARPARFTLVMTIGGGAYRRDLVRDRVRAIWSRCRLRSSIRAAQRRAVFAGLPPTHPR